MPKYGLINGLTKLDCFLFLRDSILHVSKTMVHVVQNLQAQYLISPLIILHTSCKHIYKDKPSIALIILILQEL